MTSQSGYDKDAILSSLEEILEMDKQDFNTEYKAAAWGKLTNKNRGRVYVSGLLGISNMCCNNCLYCGLRRDREIKRYRMDRKIIEDIILSLGDSELERLFIVSGENGGFKTDDYLRMIETAKSCGLEINLAAGVFSLSEFKEFKAAGLDIYTIKFETSNNDIFSSCKPDISLCARLEAIEDVISAGIGLGSGNIIGLKNQSLKDLADDIRLMVDLEIAWAPIVPYMPAPGTPMAEDTPMGSVDLTMKSIALLRLLIPGVRITAGQPSPGSKLGFADPEGNRLALEYGGDALFVELTPMTLAGDFDITTARKLPRLEEIKKLVAPLGLRLV